METLLKWVLGLLLSLVSFLGGNWVHAVDKKLGQIEDMKTQVALDKQAVQLYITNQEKILTEVQKISSKLDDHVNIGHSKPLTVPGKKRDQR